MINHIEEPDDLGYMYISEAVEPASKINVTNVNDSNGVFYVDFDAVMQSFGVMNRNHRYYVAENVMQCINDDERIQAYFINGGWPGEADHPTQQTKNAPLTPERVQNIKMDNTSHYMKNAKLHGNLLESHVRTAPETECGVGLAKYILAGFTPCFSARAIATMKNIGNKPTVIMRKLITYDRVFYPSHRESKAITPPHAVIKKIDYYNESGIDTSRVSSDVFIPLKEILEQVGKTDVNAQMIMESFDLSPENLTGFDRSFSHAIIADEDNVIYAKINPTTRRMMDDYFRSF